MENGHYRDKMCGKLLRQVLTRAVTAMITTMQTANDRTVGTELQPGRFELEAFEEGSHSK